MDKDQALAMLKFIADLYQIIQTPDLAEPEPVNEPSADPNGREPAPVKT